MDFIRDSAIYRAVMTPTGDGETWLRWYGAAPGAQIFPGVHCWLNPWFADNEPQTFTAPDTVEGSGQYRPHGWPKPAGDHFHGPIAYFTSGIPAAVLAGAGDQPGDYCGRKSRTGTGGVGVGGQAMPAIVGCRVLSAPFADLPSDTFADATGWNTPVTIPIAGRPFGGFDAGGFVATGYPNLITIPATGYYLVTVELPFEVSLDWSRSYHVWLTTGTPSFVHTLFVVTFTAPDGPPLTSYPLAGAAPAVLHFTAGQQLGVRVSFTSRTGDPSPEFFLATSFALLGTVSPPGPGPSGTFGSIGRVIETVTVLNGAVQAVDSEDLTPEQIEAALAAMGGISGSF